MRIESSEESCPIGLLGERDLAGAHPERRQDIFRHAIALREERLLVLHAARARYGWHPVHALKIILISALVTLVLAWLFSYVSAFGHWYAQAKNWSVSIPIPLIGDKRLDIGTMVPTSTPLGLAARLPTFGFRESLYTALGVAVLILAERLLLALFNISSIRKLKITEHELEQEVRTLKEWLTHH